ncbi:hypothetical protein [Psychrilyobacter atlanticus]|uniref:hypothetical protein n=1 Tax=Psychrilyobacter atlanticus TaxID=271091 RepID=UPI00041A1BBB|nr:hypothetical protein [Psychrilyobacter atlanticus]
MFTEEIKELTKKLKIKKDEIEKIEIKIEKLKKMSNMNKSINITQLDTKINKGEAIEMINRCTDKRLNSMDAIFSNRNETTGQWWFEPKPKKFKKTLYILLNDQNENNLYLFRIPKKTYLYPEEIFYYRKEKSSCSIRIDGNDIHEFKDMLDSKVCFSEFLEDVIAY